MPDRSLSFHNETSTLILFTYNHLPMSVDKPLPPEALEEIQTELHEQEPKGVELRMEPTTPPQTWEQFVQTKPEYSIAIDGYVADGPRTRARQKVGGVWRGPQANFNHHEMVDRLATRATCKQVLLSLRQGLFEAFSEDGEPRAAIYANDCDQDVSTTTWLLRNGHRSEQTENPLLNRLVEMEDLLDTTAGAYPMHKNAPILQELAWVYDPYNRFRSSGGLNRKDAQEFAGVVDDIGHRIDAYLVGKGDKMKLDTRYEQLASGAKWAMIREIGAQAKTGAFSDGVRAYVSTRERGDGRFTYTLGRMSPYILFPVEEMYARLNQEEGLENSEDRWGGGNSIGGSPRVQGSALSPDKVSKIVKELVDARLQ